jgi:hypothetical protein
MAEAIGVAASIVGLLAAAGKVAEILHQVVPILSALQPNAIRLSSELESTKIILAASQTLFQQLDTISERRTGLIQLDQLVTTLTSGVFLFSELETLVIALGPPLDGLKSRLKWGRKEKELGALYGRLCSFRESMSLMLNILQWYEPEENQKSTHRLIEFSESDLQAYQSQQQLLNTMQQMLHGQQDLAHRVASLENRRVLSTYAGSRRMSSDSQSTVRRIARRDSEMLSRNTMQSEQALLTPMRYDFELDLEASRPYRKVNRDTVDYSFRSSMVGSHAWSALSDISLSNISMVAVVALPLMPIDISNPQHYKFQPGLQVLNENVEALTAEEDVDAVESPGTGESENCADIFNRRSKKTDGTYILPRPLADKWKVLPIPMTQFASPQLVLPYQSMLPYYRITILGALDTNKRALATQVSPYPPSKFASKKLTSEPRVHSRFSGRRLRRDHKGQVSKAFYP